MKIPCVKSFKFLGYRFTHKSRLLPKSMINYYYETYLPPVESFSEKFQKFINRLFPNYLVETEKQYGYRTHLNTYEVDAFFDFFDKVKKNKIKDVNLSKDEINKAYSLFDRDELIGYLRKLYDEGKLGKPKPIQRFWMD